MARRMAAAIARIAIAHPDSPLGAHVTVSIGVATVAEIAGQSETLLEFADKLLYAAKKDGRDRIVEGETAAGLRIARAA
jgi:diguanylate cyclase (GGDEF)-like protein